MPHRVAYDVWHMCGISVKPYLCHWCVMAREDLHFRLRIPEDLKNKIQDEAERNHRSMTAEIVDRLSDSFTRRLSKNAAASLVDEIRNIVLGSHIHELLDDEVGQALMDYTVKNGLSDRGALTKLLEQALKANGYLKESEAP